MSNDLYPVDDFYPAGLVKGAWPGSGEVLGFLGGVEVPSGFDFELAVLGAVGRAEVITGRGPLLADLEETEGFYDPPLGESGRFDLGTDDFVAISSIEVHWDGSSGIGLSAPEEYVILPRRRVRGWPVEGIRLLRGCGGRPNSVRIVGRRGAFLQVPLDLWEAVAKDAAASAIEAGQKASGVVRRQKQGEREIEFSGASNGEVSSLSARYRADAAAVYRRYVKVAVDG